MADDENAVRKSEELDALISFYGQDNVIVLATSSEDDNGAPKEASPSHPIIIWKIRISPSTIDVTDRNCCWLEVHLPLEYPSLVPPSPYLCIPQWILDDGRKSIMMDQLLEMWTEDVEVILLWAEHCRTELLLLFEDLDEKMKKQQNVLATGEHDNDNDDNDTSNDQNNDAEEGAIRTFVSPNGTRYHQPIRHFPESIIQNEENRCAIYKGPPYHPPKAGAGETFVAHVAHVTHMDHIHWVLAELLFQDKKVKRATHNMIAYRFYDEEKQCWVADNDDDGEKGSGSKLSALLEMSNSQNVLVVVSRWFGGIHLGPSRFKYIANTARDALQEAGFIDK